MLVLTIGGKDFFDPKIGKFVTTPAVKLRLEHSLRSLAKWEAKWEVPFLSDKPKTREQTLDYIRCMDLSGRDDVDLTGVELTHIDKVNEYISAKMTATTINRRNGNKRSRDIITAEIIYYWMIQAGIPSEYDKWHLNRLLMLIEVCNVKNGPQQKMGRREQMAQQRALNAARKAKLHSRG